VFLELTTLEGAARLQGFEVLLNGPSRTVVIDDRANLLSRVDRLVRIEQPLDRSLSVRRVGLPNANHVDRERGRKMSEMKLGNLLGRALLAVVGRTHEGDSRGCNVKLHC